MPNLSQIFGTPGQLVTPILFHRVIPIIVTAIFLLLHFPLCWVAAEEMGVREEGLKQMQEILDQKTSRTPAQKKISSDLLKRMEGKLEETGRVPTLESRVPKEFPSPDSVLVDINTTGTETEFVEQQILEVGGTVISNFPKYQSIRAQIPISQLEKLAELPDINSIRSADTFQLHR